MMHFSESPPWFYAEDECKSLYVHKAYQDIEKLLKIHENQPRTTLVVGTPGVGKSFFSSLHAVQGSLQGGKIVFFHCAVRNTIYMNNSIVTTTDKCPPAKHKPIFDSGSSRLIAFTSPSHDNCHEFQEISRCSKL